MSDRLTFHAEDGGLVIKFDGKLIPAEKHASLFDIVAADMDRRVKQLSAAVGSQDGPLRVGAVRIGSREDDDPKTPPLLSTHGGKRQNAGRKPSKAPKAVTLSVSLLPSDLARLDALRGKLGRSAWVVAKIRRARIPD